MSDYIDSWTVAGDEALADGHVGEGGAPGLSARYRFHFARGGT